MPYLQRAGCMLQLADICSATHDSLTMVSLLCCFLCSLVGACVARYTFDYHDDDVYFCTADIGWITGHSYITYGPLANGASSVLVRLQVLCVYLPPPPSGLLRFVFFRLSMTGYLSYLPNNKSLTNVWHFPSSP